MFCPGRDFKKNILFHFDPLKKKTKNNPSLELSNFLSYDISKIKMCLKLLVSYLISIVHFPHNSSASNLFSIPMCPAEKLHLPVFLAARHAQVT